MRPLTSALCYVLSLCVFFIVPAAADHHDSQGGIGGGLQVISDALRIELDRLCSDAEPADEHDFLREFCNLIRNRQSDFRQRVHNKLSELGNRISAIAPECAPPFYINWNEHLAKMRDALSNPQTNTQAHRKFIRGRLAVIESSINYQEKYAEDLCSHYRRHQNRITDLGQEREADWSLVARIVLAILKRNIERVAGDAVARFESERLEASRYRVYEMRGVIATTNPINNALGSLSGPLLSTGTAEEFIKRHYYVKRDGTVAFSLEGVPSFRRSPEGYEYEAVGNFVIRRNWSGATSDIGPAERYLSAVERHVQDAVTQKCQEWMSHPDIFEGRFLEEAPQEDDNDSARDRRIRLMLEKVFDGVEPAVICNPGETAIEARFRRAFDEVYGKREDEERMRFVEQYGARFQRMNWVGERMMDEVWIRQIMGSEAPMEEVRHLLEKYDREYKEGKARAEISYRDLEALREANAGKLAVAKVQAEGLLMQAIVEAEAQFKTEFAKLENAAREADKSREMTLLEIDRNHHAAMARIGADIEIALRNAETEVEVEIIRQRGKDKRAQLQADTELKKERVKRKGGILSSALRVLSVAYRNR